MGIPVSPETDPPNSLPTGLTRCLVVGRLEDVPSAWIERVRAERGSVEPVSHPIIAFAEALRHEVADRLRPSFGLSRQESIAIVFAGEGFRGEFDSLAAAVRAHAPEVGVWSIDGGTIRRATVERAAPDPTRPPSLRLAGTEPEPTRAPPPATPPPKPIEEAPTAAPTGLEASVTPEEIDMLLSFFDADPGADPAGGPEVRR